MNYSLFQASVYIYQKVLMRTFWKPSVMITGLLWCFAVMTFYKGVIFTLEMLFLLLSAAQLFTDMVLFHAIIIVIFPVLFLAVFGEEIILRYHRDKMAKERGMRKSKRSSSKY